VRIADHHFPTLEAFYLLNRSLDDICGMGDGNFEIKFRCFQNFSFYQRNVSLLREIFLGKELLKEPEFQASKYL
jgi:hypothetical protein